MSLLSAEQVEIIALHPISPESPAGDSVRLEPSFEQIESELSKLDDFNHPDPVRWDEVARTAQQILSAESKDLLVACYLTRSLCEFDFVGGLNQGLQLTKTMAERYWDQAHPPKKRTRGRSQAFSWLMEKCRPLLESYQPKLSDLEALQQAEASLTELDDFLLERLTDQAPNLVEFRQVLRRCREGLVADQQVPATSPKTNLQEKQSGANTIARATTAPATTPSAPRAPESHGAVSDEKELLAVYRTVQEQLQSASQYLLSKDLKDPEAYRINRLITWLGVNQMPPSQAGKTQLRPVARDRLDYFQGLYQQEKWPELIIELERSLIRAPFWLDGQKMVVDAMEQMGCEAGIEQVVFALKLVLQRIPQIEQGCFNDGSAFASSSTQQWLNRIESEKPQQAQPVPGVLLENGSVSAEWEQSYEQAMELAAEKKIREALALFQAGANRAQSKREQTLWQFNQARFCVQQGLSQLALPLLHSIDKALLDNGSVDWEPQVSKQVICLLLECYQSQPQNADNEFQIQQLHSRLCQLDLALAFDFKQLN